VRLNLCTVRDFQRCRRRVRQLARGLPTFDFVWIDALVQSGCLTPFQANILANSPPESLCVGPYILLDRLGRGERAETFLAGTPGGIEKVVLKRMLPPALSLEPTPASAAGRLRSFLSAVDGLDSPFVVAPHSLIESDAAIVAVSRFIQGANCSELLVRRGRFPVEVVAEIARQIAHGFAALESRGCLHGEIRLANVRLTASGHAVLVDAGIAALREETVLIRDDIDPARYDGIAPELIGTGNRPTTATEMYAFGCLLWQLLAGRAPFPTGDPLGKLASHQSRAVPDVSELAPDTPPPLADAVRALTQYDASRRPADFATVAANFGLVDKSGERRITRFVRLFNTAASRAPLPAERFPRLPIAITALLLFVLSGFALSVWDMAAIGRFLPFGSSGAQSAAKTADRSAAPSPGVASEARDGADATRRRLRSLPAPSAAGVVVLDGGLYEAETIHGVGDVTIRGAGKTPSRIVVDQRPLKVVCRKFSMENVILQERSRPNENGARRDDTPLEALLVIRSQELILARCGFESTDTFRADSSRRVVTADLASGAAKNPPAVVWRSAAARDPDAGHIRVQNSVFLNAGPAIVCASAPSRIEIDNALKIVGVLLEFQEWPSRDFSVLARRVTIRQGEALCWASGGNVGRRKGRLQVLLRDCVFDLAGPQAGLLQLTSSVAPRGQESLFDVAGGESVITPGVPVVAWRDAAGNRTTPVEMRSDAVEGLAAGEFKFDGPLSRSPRDSTVDRGSLQVPRRSDDPPGIRAEELIAGFGPSARTARVDKEPERQRR